MGGSSMKPDRGTTSQRKLGLIESDDEKADSLQSGSAQYNADFGEDSCILALDAAEKQIGQTEWRRGWDSAPRLCFPNTRFPSVLLKPLGHLSASYPCQ